MTLLLLAGTGEARRIAGQLADAKVDAVASLAGATRQPEPLALKTRHGGFGGADGFREFVATAGITAVLDATHPFASQISNRTATICADLGLPSAQFLRPEWVAQPGDNWTMLENEEDAAQHIPTDSTVFLATGRQTLPQFANLQPRRMICRQIDPPDQPFPFLNGEFLIGRPPFSVQDEIDLFKRLQVDWLLVKNAGGSASRTKLDAARELGISVGMIKRPPQPNGRKFETVEHAVAWAKSPE